MECIKNPNKTVLVEDCEECLSSRNADPVCFQRDFVWGCQDGSEPRWVCTAEEAKKTGRDVSHFFNPEWAGNAHLRPPPNTQSNRRKKYIPPEIRWEVWGRDNFTCRMCGCRKFLSIDHIYPESKGGKTVLSNLQTLCCSCNSKKGARVE